MSFRRTSPLSATRSSSVTGARRWLNPRARTLIRTPMQPSFSQRSLPYARPFERPPGGHLLSGFQHVHPVLSLVSCGLALLVEGQDLELNGQIDLTHIHMLGHIEDHWSKVEDAGDAGRDEPVAHPLRG